MDVVTKIHKILSEYGIHDFGDNDLDNSMSNLANVVISAKILEELENINATLKAMKKQEFDYWETWKKKKEKELDSNGKQ